MAEADVGGARVPIGLQPAEYWELVARVRQVKALQLDQIAARARAAQDLEAAQAAVDACLDRLRVTYPGLPADRFALDDATCTLRPIAGNPADPKATP
jgi:hypothetical protein